MRLVRLCDALDALRGGSLLLKRGRWWRPTELAVMATGRGPYLHAGIMAYRWTPRDLKQAVCLEVVEWYGGRSMLLEKCVKRAPGRWDVFSPDESAIDRLAAVEAMKLFVGVRYGWWNLLMAAVRHLPVVRLFARPTIDDAARSDRPPFCSAAVAWAYRQAGADPVHCLADHATEPGDLARSPLFSYQCTLIP